MFDAICSLIKKLRSKSRPWYRSGWVANAGGPVETATYESFTYRNSEIKGTRKEDTRIEKKPVEVVNDIIVEKPVIMLNNIKGQIKVIEHRMKVFSEQGISNVSDERMAIGFLKARLKYEKTKELFGWQVTTTEKINDLCSKYKLKLASLNGYSRTMPMEAVIELEKFMKAYKQVRTDTPPEMKLIVDDGGKETRKDPILLASSPFGRWYYILGAWDREVEFVDALVYGGK